MGGRRHVSGGLGDMLRVSRWGKGEEGEEEVVAQLMKEEELAQKQSAVLIMNLLHYIRCQFPEKSFNDKNVPALGTYEALQKYLRTLLLTMFSICEATNDLTVEEKAISFSYPNAQSTKTCMIFNRIGNKRSSICQMIHTSVHLMRTLDKMPEKPIDYEPPFIRGCTDKDGNMSSKHFVSQHDGVLDPMFPKMTKKLLCYAKFYVSNVKGLLLVKKSVLNPCYVDNEEKDLMEGDDMLVDSSSSDNDSGVGDFLSKADEYDPAGVWTADNDVGCWLNEYELDFFYVAPLDAFTIGIFVKMPSGVESSLGTPDEYDYRWIAETTVLDCLQSGSLLYLKAHIRHIVDNVGSPLVLETYASRRGCLIFTATTVLTAVNLPSANAKDIPLFGLRKKLEKAEEKAEEIVKEGFETVEKGIDTVESGIESAEKGVVAAEKGIESAAESVSFSGLAQAGVVAGAEFLGVLIATSIVNGILGSQPQKT
uniref:Uncharacterized protein n=1 Tax=Chenopodium quinoa TaxID=63459 RepID=A0A803MCP8_CHEQI